MPWKDTRVGRRFVRVDSQRGQDEYSNVDLAATHRITLQPSLASPHPPLLHLSLISSAHTIPIILRRNHYIPSTHPLSSRRPYSEAWTALVP